MWLTNLYNPKNKDAGLYIATLVNETREVAWNRQAEWLKDKIIGYPKATEHYTVQELLDMGYVGVYSNPTLENKDAKDFISAILNNK